MINLEDFISESLTQLMKGVKRAQDQCLETGAVISPQMRSTTDDDTIGCAEGFGGQPCHNVDFDIAVTATENKSTAGRVGVEIGVLGLGSRGQSENEVQNISRLKFKVPVVLPLQGKGQRT